MTSTEDSTVFFGKPWLASTDAGIQVDTPVDDPCLCCWEPIAEDDQGLMLSLPFTGACGPTRPITGPVHRACTGERGTVSA